MTRYVICSEVCATSPVLNTERVIINLKTGLIFSLNSLGARIWTSIEEGHTFDAIVDSLSQEYDVSPEQLRTDLETFVLALEKKGLVQAVTDPFSNSRAKEARHVVRA